MPGSLAAHAGLACSHDGLGAVAHLELAEDVRVVVADGLGRDDQSLADDLVQEAMLKALRSASQLKNTEAINSWLGKILANCWSLQSSPCRTHSQQLSWSLVPIGIPTNTC